MVFGEAGLLSHITGAAVLPQVVRSLEPRSKQPEQALLFSAGIALLASSSDISELHPQL